MIAAVSLMLTFSSGQTVAKEELPMGLLAMSCDQRVIIAHPLHGPVAEIQTGPVGRLFPAPGGIVYAPDLVNGKTTVIDMKTLQPLERLDGITMPCFGFSDDRYVVAGRDVLLVSYPERAFIAEVKASLQSPWQVIVSDDDGVVLILERSPEGSEVARLVAVDLHQRQVVYSRVLATDVVSMALSIPLGLLALAEPERGNVTLCTPASMAQVMTIPVGAETTDVTFMDQGTVMAAAAALEGGGVLKLVRLKQTRKGLRAKKPVLTALPARPVQLAVGPWDQRVAVGLADGRIGIVSADRPGEPVWVMTSPGMRDLVWCDPDEEGPLLPEWSDRRDRAPELSIGFKPAPRRD